MQNHQRNVHIADAEPMVGKTGVLAKWTVIFIAVGMLELIAMVILNVLHARILFDNQNIIIIILIESSLLIFVVAPVFGFSALRTASNILKKVSASIEPNPQISIPLRTVAYLCVAGILFAFDGFFGTLLIQQGPDFFLGNIIKAWLGIVVALGLFLVIASCALAKKPAIPVNFHRRALVLAGLLSILWLLITLRSTIQYVADRVELAAKHKTFDGPSSNLEGTIVVPTLDTPINPGKNIVWCSSFQLAWNEMKNALGGEPLRIPDANQALVARLNDAPQSADDLEKESYLIAAGPVGDGIVKKIDSELQSRFSTAPPPEFELDRLDPDGFLAYAYLTANVPFEHPFREYKYEFIFEDSHGQKTPVKSFGVWEAYLPRYEEVARQISILYAKGSDPNYPYDDIAEFALDLSEDTEPYQIILAVIEPCPTLADTLETLYRKMADYARLNSTSEYAREFSDVDQLIVPEMFWRIAHRFQELEGKVLVSKNLTGPVQLAAQIIEFKLDRSGAILESHAAFSVAAVPRYFHFNRPFLLYIKKRNRDNPFFVMWIDNAELLSKF